MTPEEEKANWKKLADILKADMKKLPIWTSFSHDPAPFFDPYHDLYLKFIEGLRE